MGWRRNVVTIGQMMNYKTKQLKLLGPLLPLELLKSLEVEHSETQEEKSKPLTVSEFKEKLEEYIRNLPKGLSYSTQTGKWEMEIVNYGEGNAKWEWYGVDPRIELIATPFPEGKNGMVVYFQTDDDDLGQPVIEYREFYPTRRFT